MKGTNKKPCKNIKGSLKLTTLGFTLVELLAVIVILAIILVIAVPKVMSVIEDAKKATLESTAKMIASAAEKQKVQNTVLGNSNEITCDSVAKINKLDYASCSITFEDNTAKVTIEGSGKFEGLYVCGGIKTNAVASNKECASICGLNDMLLVEIEAVKPYEVDNYDSCLNYLSKELPNYGVSQDIIEEVIPILCRGESVFEVIVQLIEMGFTEKELIENNVIKGSITETCILETPAECFAFDSETGTITGYDINCGTDVVIPSKIKGINVVEIGSYAFTSNDVSIDEDYSNVKNLSNVKENTYQIMPILSIAVEGLGIENLKIPNGVTKIGDYAFSHNSLKSLNLPSTIKEIGYRAFEWNYLNGILDLSQLTNLVLIGSYAFDENNISNIILPLNIETITEGAFAGSGITGVLDLSGYTNLKIIEHSAFGWNDITTVKLPISITTIGDGAFSKSNGANPNLIKIINPSGNSFYWNWILYGSSGVYKPPTVTGTFGSVEVTES